jgi:tRNA pseudouridine38-40 synthase
LIRIKAIISYDGSKFSGFQKQKKLTRTVASDIECALSSLGIECNVVGAGRTDSGVHATGQVINFDVPYFWSDTDKLKIELNRKLSDIVVKRLVVVADDFHARFGAKSREYKYCFSVSKQTVFMKNYISLYDIFEIPKLVMALKQFEGEHDFAFFCKSGSDVGSTVRNITLCRYKRYKNIDIITIRANGFLRSQVRMIVDMSMKCAVGKISLEDISNQVNCKEKISTTLAPAKGLYLTKVIY